MKKERYQKEIFLQRLVFRLFMVLFFCLAVYLITVQVRPLPKNSDLKEWRAELKNYENLAAENNAIRKNAFKIRENINGLDFKVQQSQKTTEIERSIDDLKRMNTGNYGMRYSNYNKAVAGVLRKYFDISEESAVVEKELEILRKDYDNASANLPKEAITQSSIL